jgi:hypothetical protein
MKILPLFAALPLLALAACGGSGGDANSATPAAPVAAKPAPAGTAWVDTVVKTPEGGMRMGNPDAPLKIVEYGSRACPYCGKFDQEGFPALKEKYISAGKVSYEFREYPVHGPLDLGPILLGQCSGDTATFFPILDQMFANQQTLLTNEQAVSAKVQAAQGATPNQVATMYAEACPRTRRAPASTTRRRSTSSSSGPNSPTTSSRSAVRRPSSSMARSSTMSATGRRSNPCSRHGAPDR